MVSADVHPVAHLSMCDAAVRGAHARISRLVALFETGGLTSAHHTRICGRAGSPAG